MGRHRWRESVKSFFGSHIDPQKDEQLKGTRTEIDDKISKILEIINEEDLQEKDGISLEKSKRQPLAELIADFHKHYQSLYDRYDHLTGELRGKFHRNKENGSSSSSSDSDSDSDYSSKDKGSTNGRLKNEYKEIVDATKQKLERASSEVAGLKSRLTAATEEKDALISEHQRVGSDGWDNEGEDGEWEGCGPNCRRMEMDLEGVRWAVYVGIWVMCLGLGYLVSRASAKSLRRSLRGRSRIL